MTTLSHTDKAALLIETAKPLKRNEKSNSNCLKYKLVSIVSIVALITVVLIIILYIINSSTSTYKKVTANDIRKLRELLTALYANSTNSFGDQMPLIPTVIRLAFHDCGGPPTNILNSSINYNHRYNINVTSICDGCIDLSNTNNHGGLEMNAILPLEQVYLDNFSDIMSRSDFWIASALIALEIASAQKRPDQDTATHIPNLGFWFGRVDCPMSYEQYIAYDSNEGNFSFPNGDAGWDDSYNWFHQQFNLTKRETITLMGAHTLGRAHVNISGYEGGWIGTDIGTLLLNAALYFIILDRSEHGNQWKQVNISQSGKKQWIMTNKERMVNNNTQLMLNSDMSLVIRIEDYLNSDTGGVSCSFVDSETVNIDKCPQQTEIIDIVREYANNNTLWVHEFATVFQKMTFSGYDVLNDDSFYVVHA